MLDREFYHQDPRPAALALLGAELRWNGASGRIVEVEAYEALGDEACHTFFRPGARDFVAAHPPGSAYVYLNYGMHWLFNVLVKGPSAEGFVLVRALEPLSAVEKMRERRSRTLIADLCSGPGKLTQALGITGADHGADLCASPERALLAAPEESLARPALADARVGITRAADFLWRYLLADSRCLSVRPGSLAIPAR